MRKLLALCLAMMMSFSLVACGGSSSSDAEVEVEEEVTTEVEVEAEDDFAVVDISTSIAGNWIDEDGMVYVFGDDGNTLGLLLPDGTEVYGEYLLEASTEGLCALNLWVADLDLEIAALLTDLTETTLEFTDIENGVPTVMTPYVEEEAAGTEIMDISAEMFDTYWIDDDGVEYAFYDDNTMELYFPDESVAAGQYLFEYNEADGNYYLSFVVADLGVDSPNQVTAMDETGMAMVDLYTGVETTLLITG